MERIDETYVLQASRLAGIELTAKQLPGVVEQLRHTAALAQVLEDFVLPVNGEIAPTWQP